MLQHYRAEARRVIWDLRGSEPELQSLDSEVRSAVAELTRERGIATSVEVEGEQVRLPRAMAHNLLRICQEATSNAVRHGTPSRIEVRLRFGEGRVEAAVHDDGAGFDPAAVPDGHFGLEIIRERARHFGGDVVISSRKGGGTTVVAALPYSGNSK
jgi:signal transduction histidine kinase